jgi:hypothetical protein
MSSKSYPIVFFRLDWPIFSSAAELIYNYIAKVTLPIKLSAPAASGWAETWHLKPIGRQGKNEFEVKANMNIFERNYSSLQARARSHSKVL